MKKKLIISLGSIALILIALGYVVENFSFASVLNDNQKEIDSPLYTISLKQAIDSLEGKNPNIQDPNRAKIKIVDPRCPPSMFTATCDEHPCPEETVDCTFSGPTCNFQTCSGYLTCGGESTCRVTCSGLNTMDCSNTCDGTHTCDIECW